jgi:hypothetical protein
MTLLGAVSFGFAVEAFIDWVFDPHGLTTFRWILLLLVLAFALASLSARGDRPRHAVQLVNAAGCRPCARRVVRARGAHHVQRQPVAPWAPAGSSSCSPAVRARAPTPPVDRERGPAYLGVVVLCCSC